MAAGEKEPFYSTSWISIPPYGPNMAEFIKTRRTFVVNEADIIPTSQAQHSSKVFDYAAGDYILLQTNASSMGAAQHSSKVFDYAAGDYILLQTNDSRMLAVSVNDWQSSLSVKDKKRSQVRRSFETPELSEGRYEVRVKRLTVDSDDDFIQDSVYLNEVVEVINDDVAHIHTALLALKIKMNEQINGLPEVTSEALAVKLVYDRNTDTWAEEFTSNPAWHCLDAMMNSRYGGGYPLHRLDLDAFVDWAEHCDANKLTFDGVIDGEGNMWDAIKPIMRAGHAQVFRQGNRYTVAIERAEDPVQVFNVGNIINGSLVQTWLPVADRANVVELTYFDEENDNKSKTVKVVDTEMVRQAGRTRPAQVTMYGIVNEAHALREANLMLAMNRYILQSVSFKAQLDAIACKIGSVILVQHDQPEWGAGGLLKTGSTKKVIKLDRPVSMSAGKRYGFLVVYPALKVGESLITAKGGQTLMISGTPPAKADRVRVISGGVTYDYPIRSMTPVNASSFTVLLESTELLFVGNLIEFWRVDAIEERDVVTVDGEFETITLQTDLPSAPERHARWSFGPVNKVRKPFRVQAINGVGMEEREITAVEYNESIYTDDPQPTQNYSSLETTVAQSKFTEVWEELRADATQFTPVVHVEFENSSSQYAATELWISINREAFIKVGEAKQRFSFDAVTGDSLRVRLVAKGVATGDVAQLGGAPIATYTVKGKLAPPAGVEGYKVTVRSTDILHEWLPNTADVDLLGYEIREGRYWDEGPVIIADYSGTMHITDKDRPGEYHFMIRSKDRSGIYSSEISHCSVRIEPPAIVQGFDVVQNGDAANFYWTHNAEPSLVGYEIREGANWESSQLVATNITANRFGIQIGGARERSFLIKAIVAPGVYGEHAAYTKIITAAEQSRNIIVSIDQAAAGFPGTKTNAREDGNKLQMKDAGQYAEYTFPIVLPDVMLARNVPYIKLESIKLDTETWGTANYTWAEASRQWGYEGAVGSVDGSMLIAIKDSAAVRMFSPVETWSLQGNPAGNGGSYINQSRGITYKPNRGASGAAMTEFSRIWWGKTVPETFSYKFWFTPDASNVARVLVRGDSSSGVALQVIHYPQSGQLVLRDDRRLGDVSLEFPVAIGVPLLICISQTATTREFRVGTPDGKSAKASAQIPPIQGGLSLIKLG